MSNLTNISFKISRYQVFRSMHENQRHHYRMVQGFKRNGASVRQRLPLTFRLLHEVGTFHSIIRNYRGDSSSRSLPF